MTDIRSTIIEALHESGNIIRSNFGQNIQAEYKGEIDIVTAIDKKCEETIISIIKKKFPNHSILAEESGKDTQTENYSWIIDPIDGTTNFFHSFPVVCTSIAVAHKNEIILGGIYDPLRDELFFAEKGKGAVMNGQPIKVSQTEKLDKSLLATGFAYDRRQHADYYLSYFKAFMLKTQGTRRAGAAALDLCYVACGRIDGFWEFKLKPWDVAAGKLIVEEAGGKISMFNGNTFDLFGNETLASNSKIHSEMIEIIQSV